ncbi:MAG TPA: histone deacetylase [Gemmatimonadales bacterium]|nr:histone deacetylase [Gemmatimonadales bacterium]
MRVFSSRACLAHPGFPEQPARLVAVLDTLRRDGRAAIHESEPAATELLELVHPAQWIETIRQRAALGEPAGEETPLSPGSWPAILAAAGAVLAATDAALEGTPSFAAVRPPGHHASAIRAMGFCPVNLVAIAVARARSRGAERALIIDWDVHHGNGTQDIVAAEPRTRFVSMHQENWYPGTGAASDTGVGNCFNLPMPPGLPRREYVESLWSGIERASRDWQPDAIFISAGYDGMAGDPLGGFTLEPDDYRTWMDRLRDRWPETPLLATMEGGYEPRRLAAGVLATVT